MTYASLAPNRARSRQAGAYAQVGLETQVMSASPEKLIELLYDGAHQAIARAKIYMELEDHVNRRETISKAIDIVESGLKASVDESVGPVAKQLVGTYNLIVQQLLYANIHNDVQHLDAADKALREISSAWKIITAQQ